MTTVTPDPETVPHPGRAVLVTIDVQRDVTLAGAPAEVPGTARAVPAMAHVVRSFRRGGRPVVHVVRLYRPDGSDAERCRRRAIAAGRPLLVPGSPGAELVDELKPRPGTALDAERLLAGELQVVGEGEWAMYKPRWGAFYHTPLESHLERLDVDTVVVCGCNFPNCPRTTVYQASERDLRVALVTDATSGLYERARDELAAIGVALVDAEACVAWYDRLTEPALRPAGP
ncbi:MAG: cysteine hydrolase family protein [Acidimicrobiales bacterium]